MPIDMLSAKYYCVCIGGYEYEDAATAVEIECLANANLIAAAPDLLKALKDLLSVELCYDDDFVKAGLAAIKKAES